MITYEEYHPYGSTAFQSSGSSEVSPKRYRYTGKEKDEETGLYYQGARYYVPWLGRWTAADPAGYVDGTNLYQYSRNNPATFADPAGTQAKEYAEYYGLNREPPPPPDRSLIYRTLVNSVPHAAIAGGLRSEHGVEHHPGARRIGRHRKTEVMVRTASSSVGP